MPAILRRSAIPRRRHNLSLTSFSSLAAGLFLLGFLSACFLVALLRDSLYEPVATLFQNTVEEIPSLSVTKSNMFFYSIREHLKIFLLLAFFSFTNAWRLCCSGYMLYTGFTQGLFFAFCLLLKGAGGFMQYLCFLLPQSLLLIPVFFLLIDQLDQLHSDFFTQRQIPEENGAFPGMQKGQLLLSKLPFLLLCIFLLVACAFLEGYLNVPLLRYYHAKF